MNCAIQNCIRFLGFMKLDYFYTKANLTTSYLTFQTQAQSLNKRSIQAEHLLASIIVGSLRNVTIYPQEKNEIATCSGVVVSDCCFCCKIVCYKYDKWIINCKKHVMDTANIFQLFGNKTNSEQQIVIFHNINTDCNIS